MAKKSNTHLRRPKLRSADPISSDRFGTYYNRSESDRFSNDSAPDVDPAKLIDFKSIDFGTGKRGETISNDALNAYFENELRTLLEPAFETRMARLSGRDLFPHVFAPNAWEKLWQYRVSKTRGIAAPHDLKSNDVPRVNSEGEEFSRANTSWALETVFSMNEIREAQATGNRLEQDQMRAVRRGLLEAENDFIFNGTTSLPGLLTTAGVPNGAATETAWTGLSDPDLILAAIYECIDTIQTGTLETASATDLLLPTGKYNLISRMRLPDTGETLLNYLLQATGLNTVRPVRELALSGTGSTDQMIAYQNDLDTLRVRTVMDIQSLPPHVGKMQQVEVPWILRSAGLIILRPLELCKRHTI